MQLRSEDIARMRGGTSVWVAANNGPFATPATTEVTASAANAQY